MFVKCVFYVYMEHCKIYDCTNAGIYKIWLFKLSNLICIHVKQINLKWYEENKRMHIMSIGRSKCCVIITRNKSGKHFWTLFLVVIYCLREIVTNNTLKKTNPSPFLGVLNKLTFLKKLFRNLIPINIVIYFFICCEK